MDDIKKITNKLLFLSNKIIHTFDILADLSYYNHEDTKQYFDAINDIKELTNQESAILKEIDTSTLEEIINYIETIDDGSDSYARTLIMLDDKMDSLLEEDLDDIELEDDNILSEFYLNTSDIKEYKNYVIDKTAIASLKKMYTRISKTKVDNKRDNKYRSNLLKELKVFKYTVYGLNNRLEKIRIENLFCIDLTPDIVNMDIDLSAIYHNQCVLVLEKLYETKINEKDISLVIEALFNMIYFEECLNKIDSNSATKLLKLCEVLKLNNKNTFGEFGVKKLLLKQKN